MASRITATTAARTFSELVNRVRYRGEVFIVERAGEPVCQIGPTGVPHRTVRDLVGLLRAPPRPDRAYLDAVERAAKKQPRLPRSPWRP